ncbi:MAG: addiction module toxin RelE [Betaproteobacteria bacterium RIFCSPLOWO2_12_FULL_62_13]|nr:MAG: addiction module toxin RelE [Betaproteobacteria bacterium RIFCSPLOWO2_12_FULL_62_13]
MAWTVEISAFAQKQLKKLDKPVAGRILDWLQERIEGCKNPRHFGEPLKGELAGLWRYRVGDFRVICEIQDDRLVVLALSVGHRREVYRKR